MSKKIRKKRRRELHHLDERSAEALNMLAQARLPRLDQVTEEIIRNARRPAARNPRTAEVGRIPTDCACVFPPRRKCDRRSKRTVRARVQGNRLQGAYAALRAIG
jgi:hypothetical protein